MTIQNAIKLIHSESDSWVWLEQTRKVPRGLELRFGIHRGKRGARIDSWSVRCLGVREATITALDGGGLRLYPGTHPAALRYTARRAELRLTWHPRQGCDHRGATRGTHHCDGR